MGSTLPFTVHHHAAAKSHIAVSNLGRIQEDVAYYANKENAAQVPALR